MNTLSPSVARRRRLVTRALPLTFVGVVAFGFGVAAGIPGNPERDAAGRFGSAWAGKNYGAMYAELNAESQQQIQKQAFVDAYRKAGEVATLRGIEVGEPGDTRERGGATVVPLEVAATTVAFGGVEDEVELRYEDGGIAWSADLTFPGLDEGEHLENRIDQAERSEILAIDGTPLAKGPAGEREHPLSAAGHVTGEIGVGEEAALAELAKHGFPPGTLVGISGLEKAFNSRLAGTPGGALLAVADNGGAARVLSEAKPKQGSPLKTTIDPDLQEAAVTALAGRAGGIAVLDARSGDVRALAGYAFSAPQPPGSTFKILTTVAALEKEEVALDDYFEITDGVNVGGRFISNANGELCGGTFREAFAHSCNADFAPLGPAIGNDGLVDISERFGFNSPPTLYRSDVVEEVEPAESTIPTEIGADIDLAVSAIGQGEVMATPLQMASVAQTIANGGVRMPTSVVANAKLRPEMSPVRVTTRKIARQLNELMVGVVAGGTGSAAAIAAAQVAGKTGTAELGPVEGQEHLPEPEQKKDAWFTAFAPAKKPRYAVAVLLIEAGASGGEVAAPAAGEVLSAGF